MAARAKPAGCCAPRAVKPLPERKLERVAMVAKALADPNRIEILRLLAQQAAPVCACDIVVNFDLSQPTVSHHLKILVEARLLRRTRKGLWAFYQVDPDGAHVLEGLAGLLASHEVN